MLLSEEYWMHMDKRIFFIFIYYQTHIYEIISKNICDPTCVSEWYPDIHHHIHIQYCNQFLLASQYIVTKKHGRQSQRTKKAKDQKRSSGCGDLEMIVWLLFLQEGGVCACCFRIFEEKGIHMFILIEISKCEL